MCEIKAKIIADEVIECIDTLKDKMSDIAREEFKGLNQEDKKRIVQIVLNSKFLINYINEPQLIFKPISDVPDKNDWQQKPILETPETKFKEPLVALNGFNSETQQIIQLHNRIFAKPAYFEQGINRAMPIVYVRLGVAKALIEYLRYLPEKYGIIVYDGYRPIEVQQALYDIQYKIEQSKQENKGCTHEELENITKMFVSIPSKDPTKPSTHNTGGAIDFSICDENGNELNFGCNFDDFREIANLTYFEDKLKAKEQLSDIELEALLNRRILCNLARNEHIGLQPYNGEWWHYDKNNQWDCKLSQAIYGSIDLVGLTPNDNSIGIDDVIRNDDRL